MAKQYGIGMPTATKHSVSHQMLYFAQRAGVEQNAVGYHKAPMHLPRAGAKSPTTPPQ